MSVFDPYDRSRPPVPGLNTGSRMQVSTLGQIDTDGLKTNTYRSGALLALAPFVGWCSVLLATLMSAAGFLGRSLCLEGRLSATVCTTEPSQLILVPIGVLVLGVTLAAIGGSLAKRRRAPGSLATLIAGVVMLVAVTQWFGESLLGLPFL